MNNICFISIPIVEILRHGDFVAGTENVLRTVFAYTNENSLKNCLQLSESIG